MTKPLFSVKHVASLALLPKNLTIGRAYFVDDEQVIVINHGDGRGPVTYGGKPGPQGMAGEPVPSLQGQIDELASASLLHTINLNDFFNRTKIDFEHLKSLITDNIDMLKSQNEDNANAVLNLLLITSKKFAEYDSAINILAQTLSNFYPSSHGGTAGDGTNDTTTGIITAEDGTQYKIEQAYVEGDTGVLVLTIYDTERINTLNKGDKVSYDSGYFIIDNIQNNNDNSGVIALTLYET